MSKIGNWALAVVFAFALTSFGCDDTPSPDVICVTGLCSTDAERLRECIEDVVDCIQQNEDGLELDACVEDVIDDVCRNLTPA